MHLNFGFFRQLIAGRMATMVSDRGGNVALTVAICIIPMILAVGAGLDYTRAYNVQSRMQSDLDAALVAAIKEIDEYDEDEIAEKIKDWFDAQSEKQSATYDLTEITVDKSGHTITASASGTVPTTLMTLADIKTVPVGVISAIEGRRRPTSKSTSSSTSRRRCCSRQRVKTRRCCALTRISPASSPATTRRIQ